jgi:hypothetical protein
VFAATSLKLRPASQINIPAELPNGQKMGQKIDNNVRPYLKNLQNIQDPRAKAIAIQSIRKLLEQNFETIVEESKEYKSHYTWSDILKLKNNQVQVRPTVHEIYFFIEQKIANIVRKIIRERASIRQKIQRKPSKNIDKMFFAFPEEFNSKWLKSLGNVLGYPSCCVKQFSEDRYKGINVEVRAAQQLLKSFQNGEIDPHVYYTGYFIPCSPHCEKAIEMGHVWHETFTKTNIELGELYKKVILMNAEIVLKQPDLIKKHLSQLS